MRRLAEICERVAATSKNLEKIAAVRDYLQVARRSTRRRLPQCFCRAGLFR